MASEIYHFWAESNGTRAYVRLNGYPLFGTEPERPHQSGEDITAWIIPGINKLEVSTAMVPETTPADGNFKALTQTAYRADMDAARVVWEFQWPPPGTGDLVPFYRVFEISCRSPTRVWDHAATILPDTATEHELRVLAVHLHDVFSSGDPEAMADELEFKGRDVGLTIGLTEEEGIASQKRFLKAIMGRDDFSVSTWNPDHLKVRYIADGTLAWLKNGDSPLLLSEQRQGMDVFVAKIDGRWTVVR